MGGWVPNVTLHGQELGRSCCRRVDQDYGVHPPLLRARTMVSIPLYLGQIVAPDNKSCGSCTAQRKWFTMGFAY